jgi:hypothetical protein
VSRLESIKIMKKTTAKVEAGEGQRNERSVADGLSVNSGVEQASSRNISSA